MLRVLDIILFTFTPLNRLEYLVAQLVTASPFVAWFALRQGHVFFGFPLVVSDLLVSMFLAFSVRRLLVLGCNVICNVLAMGAGKSILPVTYAAYYLGLLLLPSAKPRPMWTHDLRR